MSHDTENNLTNTLPDEMLGEVASFLVGDDRASCAFACVCRRFRRVAYAVFDQSQAFIRACYRGYADIVQGFLADGRVDPAAAINVVMKWRDRHGVMHMGCVYSTDAICVSSRNGHADIVKLLLADGRADPTVRDNEPIRMSCASGQADVVRLLLADPRVDPAAKNNNAICMSSRNAHTDVVQLLLADGRADPAACSNVAILMSCANGDDDVVRLLLADPRVDPTARDNYAIRMSSKNRHAHVIQLLLVDGRADPMKRIDNMLWKAEPGRQLSHPIVFEQRERTRRRRATLDGRQLRNTNEQQK